MTEFEIARMKKFAIDFCDVYEAAGEEAAGAFAYTELKEKDYGLPKKFIQEELHRRGYSLEIFEDA